jgi:hypothetical protein
MGRIKTKRRKIKYFKILKLLLFYSLLSYLVLFFLISLLEIKIAFEYDGVVVDSEKVFEFASSNGIKDKNSVEYWEVLNTAYNLEELNKSAIFIASIFKIFGFDVVFITFRQAHGAEQLIQKWKWLPDSILFEFKENLTELFESENFQIYFYVSDFPNKHTIEENVLVINYNNFIKRLKRVIKF